MQYQPKGCAEEGSEWGTRKIRRDWHIVPFSSCLPLSLSFPHFEMGKQLRESHCLERCQGTAVVSLRSSNNSTKTVTVTGRVIVNEAKFEAKGEFPKNGIPNGTEMSEKI